jgi:hypothetical protein
LIVKYFNDAVYQYQDKWLGLQSLDVYIPSLKMLITFIIIRILITIIIVVVVIVKCIYFVTMR